MSKIEHIRSLLETLYGRESSRAFERIAALMANCRCPSETGKNAFTERDVVLIAYGDTLQDTNRPPLKVLQTFARHYLTDCLSAVHLLPFFPFSSDDGFSVVDFFNVDPALGDWEDVTRLGEDFELMFDFVLNHVSAASRWFGDYLAERPGFTDLAIEVDPETDLSAVVRPRTLPLLTPFTKRSGRKVHLWTTFSADQIDLNYKSIDVLTRMVHVLLHYVERGAGMVRMDAVAYLWKEPGTPSIHLPQTYAVVRLLRAILDEAAPHVRLITETNVPHTENVSYFGNGYDQAQMVYNFSLPPLLLHAFIAADTEPLSAWAGGLRTPSERTAFFNFTASHDGIGVRPLEGILPGAQIDRLVNLAAASGGAASFRRHGDGSRKAYELNVTYVDALGLPGQRGTPAHAARFLASQAIALCLPGVPGIYLHSLLGSRNWQEGVERTGRARTINREKLNLAEVEAELGDSSGFRAYVFHPYRKMLTARRQQPAFHPQASCEIVPVHRRVFGVRRAAGGQTIYALTHIGGPALTVDLGCSGQLRDILSGRMIDAGRVPMAPYRTFWLTHP